MKTLEGEKAGKRARMSDSHEDEGSSPLQVHQWSVESMACDPRKERA